MKTILIFSAYYYPHLGGIERYIDGLMHKFIQKGIKVVLVTSNFNDAASFEIVDKIEIYRLPVYNIFKNRYPIVKKNKEFKRIISKLNKYKFDSVIVNTRFHLTSHVGIKFAKKHKLPVFLIEHGSNYVTLDNKFIDFFANRYEDFLTYKIKHKVTGFYGVSKACSEWLKNFKINASGVWYNSIDCDQKLPKRKKHNTINFLYAGRLIKQKGVENILKSFSNLEKKNNNIRLYIAGDGPELQKYKSTFNSKNIFFLGKLSYEELVKYYAITDVFLYPPLWPEGLPTSILEAGLMNCAVIGTDQGGIKEVLINKKNGLIVDTTVDSLEKAMLFLIENENKRNEYSSALYKTVKEKFSWDATSNTILTDINDKRMEM